MSRSSRRKSQPDRRSTSYARQREEHERAALAAARRAADVQAAERRVAEAGVATDLPEQGRGRLVRLGELSFRLEDVRIQQIALLAERDRIIDELRADGITLEQLAARTGMSRQALSKRRLS